MRSDRADVPVLTPRGASFDEVVLPHLEVARRLARWLLRNESDADDAVQEASLRALRYFETFTGGNARAWYLRIVRNTCHGWYVQRARHQTDSFDEALHSGLTDSSDPETLMLQRDARELVAQALDDLSPRARTLLVQREFEGLTYQELSDVMGIPIGTVMSGLSRARQALRVAIEQELEPSDGLARAQALDRAEQVA